MTFLVYSQPSCILHPWEPLFGGIQFPKPLSSLPGPAVEAEEATDGEKRIKSCHVVSKEKQTATESRLLFWLSGDPSLWNWMIRIGNLAIRNKDFSPLFLSDLEAETE